MMVRNGENWQKLHFFRKIQDVHQAAILDWITSIFEIVRYLLTTTLHVKYRKDLREIVDRKAMTLFRVNVHTSTYTCIHINASYVSSYLDRILNKSIDCCTQLPHCTHLHLP